MGIKVTDTIETSAAHGRAVKAAQVYDEAQKSMQSEINSKLIANSDAHKYLGNFSTSGEAEALAGTPKYAANNRLAVMHYTVDSDNRSGIILQQVGQSKTMQFILLDGIAYSRVIQFVDGNKTQVSDMTKWEHCFVNKIEYTEDSRLLKLWFDFVGISGVTLPLANASRDGLLKKNAWSLLMQCAVKLGLIEDTDEAKADYE